MQIENDTRVYLGTGLAAPAESNEVDEPLISCASGDTSKDILEGMLTGRKVPQGLQLDTSKVLCRCAQCYALQHPPAIVFAMVP